MKIRPAVPFAVLFACAALLGGCADTADHTQTESDDAQTTLAVTDEQPAPTDETDANTPQDDTSAPSDKAAVFPLKEGVYRFAGESFDCRICLYNVASLSFDFYLDATDFDYEQTISAAARRAVFTELDGKPCAHADVTDSYGHECGFDFTPTGDASFILTAQCDDGHEAYESAADYASGEYVLMATLEEIGFDPNEPDFYTMYTIDPDAGAFGNTAGNAVCGGNAVATPDGDYYVSDGVLCRGSLDDRTYEIVESEYDVIGGLNCYEDHIYYVIEADPGYQIVSKPLGTSNADEHELLFEADTAITNLVVIDGGLYYRMNGKLCHSVPHDITVDVIAEDAASFVFDADYLYYADSSFAIHRIERGAPSEDMIIRPAPSDFSPADVYTVCGFSGGSSLYFIEAGVLKFRNVYFDEDFDVEGIGDDYVHAAIVTDGGIYYIEGGNGGGGSVSLLADTPTDSEPAATRLFEAASVDDAFYGLCVTNNAVYYRNMRDLMLHTVQ